MVENRSGVKTSQSYIIANTTLCQQQTYYRSYNSICTQRHIFSSNCDINFFLGSMPNAYFLAVCHPRFTWYKISYWLISSNNAKYFDIYYKLLSMFMISMNKNTEILIFKTIVFHDDVIKWKHFPRNWPFVRGIHRSPVTSPHKGQWPGVLMFSLICARTKGWGNNGKAGDLRRYRAHYDVIVIRVQCSIIEYDYIKLILSYMEPHKQVLKVEATLWNAIL